VPNNILITPGSASIQFSGSAANTIRLQVETSGSIAFYGNSGSLFGITDSLSGSLMSVNDISGLPILEVFSDDRVVMGSFNKNTLVVTGSRIGIDKANPTTDLDISGSVFITGSLQMNSGGITGSLFGTSSVATTSSYILPTGLPTGIVSSSAQINTGSFTGSFIGTLTGTGSWAQSASVAISASFAPMQVGVISSSTQFTSLTAPFTGSFTGSFIGTHSGSTFGTASWAQSASVAISASFAPTAAAFPYSGSAIITGSLLITGSSTGSVVFRVIGKSGELFSVDDNLTGTLLAAVKSDGNPVFEALSDGTIIFGTGSGDLFYTSSYIGIGKIPTITAGSPKLQVNGNTVITGSLTVTAGITGSLSGSATTATSASFATTASYALSASYAPSAPGSGITSLVAGDGLTGGTITSTGTITLDTGSAHFLDGVKKELNTEGVVSSSSQINTGSFTGSFTGIFTGSLFGTSSVSVAVDSITILQVNEAISGGDIQASGITADGNVIAGVSVIAPIVSASIITGSHVQLVNVTDTTSANKVLVLNTATNKIFTTASVGGASGNGFPFSGSAIITGSLLISSSILTPLAITGSINNFFEVKINNVNAGNNASADFVAGNDITTDFGNYINMGINSTTYNGGLVGGPSDGYLYLTSSVGELHLGNASPIASSNVRLFAGGPSSDSTTRMFISASGNVGIGVTTNLQNTLTVNGSVSASSVTGSVTGSFTGALTHFSPSTLKLTVGTTAPASPSVNDLWVDTN
jgi:hypothetical protein